MKLKLLTYDKYGVVYEIENIGLSLVGRHYSSDEFEFIFPEYKSTSLHRYYIMNHNIPKFGEDIKSFFKKTAKEELEIELQHITQEDKRFLIYELFEGNLVNNREK